jgi:hypothetical protein
MPIEADDGITSFGWTGGMQAALQLRHRTLQNRSEHVDIRRRNRHCFRPDSFY